MARTLETLRAQYSKEISVGRSSRGPGVGGGRPGGSHGGKPKNTKATIGRIWHYVKIYPGRLTLVVISCLASVLAAAYATFLTKDVVNIIKDTSMEDRVAALLAKIITLAVLYSISIVANYITGRLMIGISQSAILRIRDELFDHTQQLPVRFFDRENAGELMSRYTNDVDNIGMMLDQSLISLVSGILTLIVTAVFMFFASWIVALIVLAFLPLFIFAGGFVAKRSRKYYVGQQASLGALNGYIEESISGQKVIKVFGHEEECRAEFGALNEDMRDKMFRAQFFGGILWPIVGNLSQVSYAVIVGVGGVLCITAPSLFSVGALVLFSLYARQFMRPISEISQQMTTIFAALAGGERVFSMMDENAEAADAPGCAEPENIVGNVVLSNVCFGYTPERKVLKNISLYAKPGQKIAFVGSTGAGKTTITNLLNRFYDIDEGSITIDGLDIKSIKRDCLRRNIATVLQDTHLFTGTVRENIRYGRLDATDEEVEQAARTASAHSFIMRLEHGYETVIEGDGANLSQGQRQLLNIARAAISKAPILVLDEATSSVDTRTERHIERGMDRLMKNRTTFVIAHRLSTVRNSNAIMVLEKGEIIERGTHEQLLDIKGRYYHLYTGAVELD